ncbi:MAG: hypothetical protein K9N05_00245 [Candidatus Marinimicrobia bacterium]|nr:hypothetical protein [Candidatus Neomarinimicrobiota bacterium]
MNEERLKVLNMIAEGKISAEEGSKLLEALDKKDKLASEQAEPVIRTKEKGNINYLYVDVTPKKEENKEKVHVKVPLALVRAGVNIASMLPADVQDKVNDAMGEKGMKFDLSSIKPENIEELIQALEEMEVNIDSDEHTVRVYCA